MPAETSLSRAMACLKQAARAINQCALARTTDERALLLADDASRCTSSVDPSEWSWNLCYNPCIHHSSCAGLQLSKGSNVSLALHSISRLEPVDTVYGQYFLETAVSMVGK